MLPPRTPPRLMAGWLLVAGTVGLLVAIGVELLANGDGYWVLLGIATACALAAAILVPGGLRHARELIDEHDRLTSQHQSMMNNLQQELETQGIVPSYV